MSILDTLLKDPSVLKGAMAAIGFDPSGLVGSVNRFAQAVNNISEKIDPQKSLEAPAVPVAVAPTPDAPVALPLPEEGYVRDHTGALVALDSIVQMIRASEAEKQKQTPAPPPAPRVCGTCTSNNLGQPNVSSTICMQCYTTPGLPNHATKASV